VIDDGFNLDHEDLRGAEVGFSYDAELKRLGAEPQARIDRHGTRVAGILVAQHNGKGIDGIAPKATLIPIRQVSTRTSDTVLSFTVADLAGADIINCSWNSRVLMEPVHDVIEHLARRGRGGLGTAVVFAAGNEGETLLPGSREAAMESVIAVGSLAEGRIAPYSNRGEAVDLYLPGRLRTTFNRGYGPFNGTSASAALASGLAALLLARRPRMTLGELRTGLVAGVSKIWPGSIPAVSDSRGGA
jgi:subtilisin family serine protease